MNVLLLLALILCALDFLHGFPERMDIRSADESAYLMSGAFLEAGLDPQWGPLYRFWYSVLWRVTNDPLDVYYLNYGALTVLLPVCLFLLLVRLKVPGMLAFIAAAYLVNSFIPYIWPYPVHFALLVVLVAAIVAFSLRNTMARIVIFAVGLLLAAYAHPLFMASFLVLSTFLLGYAVWLVLRAGQRIRRVAPALLGFVATSLLILVVAGNPLSRKQEFDRRFFAFAQHYSVNRIAQSGEPLNPWTDWKAVAARDFGSAESVAECARENPRAFAWHLKRNIVGTMPGLVDVARLNASFPGWMAGTFPLLAVAVALGFGLSRLAGGRHPDPRSLALVALFFVCVSAGMFLSAFVVYPRHHYLMPAWVLLLVLVLHLLARPRSTSEPRGQIVRGATIVLTVAVAFLVTSGRHRGLYPELRYESDLRMVGIIESLRALRVSDPVNLLASDKFIAPYTGKNYRGVEAPYEQEGFDEYVSRTDVNMIVLDAALTGEARFRDDETFNAFVADPNKAGFIRRRIRHRPALVLVKRDLAGHLEAEEALAGLCVETLDYFGARGFGALEGRSRRHDMPRPARWMIDASARILLNVDPPAGYRPVLHLHLRSPIEPQTVRVRVNGESIGTLQPGTSWMSWQSSPLELRREGNVLVFEAGAHVLEEGGERRLYVLVDELRLGPPDSPSGSW